MRPFPVKVVIWLDALLVAIEKVGPRLRDIELLLKKRKLPKVGKTDLIVIPGLFMEIAPEEVELLCRENYDLSKKDLKNFITELIKLNNRIPFGK